MRLFTSLLLIVTWIGSQALGADAPPKEWIDPDTGHRVIRLSLEPGSESFYFNINPYTPDGKKMVFTSPTGISVIDLATRKLKRSWKASACGSSWSAVKPDRFITTS